MSAIIRATEGSGGLVNAHLPDEMVMRVGIPHRSGRLAFHAFQEGYPVMVSSSAFWDGKSGQFKVPEHSDLWELDWALDSAGFTAMMLWKSKGKQAGMAGVFPWTYAQYVELVGLTSRAWWSQPDMCTEPELANSREELDFRINGTATLLEGTLRVVYDWHNQMARQGWSEGAIANMLPPPVPVLQGWRVEDYQRSLDMMLQVWERWEPWLQKPALIGIGSVCRRSLSDPSFGLHAILAGLEAMVPKGSKLHMFGVKGSALSQLKMLPFIGSADSMAYDFSARVKARTSGISNSIEHRSEVMSNWMKKAASRIAPAAGDQYRLPMY